MPPIDSLARRSQHTSAATSSQGLGTLRIFAPSSARTARTDSPINQPARKLLALARNGAQAVMRATDNALVRT
eukprot:6185860-Pleurochrysis_carterae.AAC.6